MATEITKFSDYAIQTIDYFIEKITAELIIRDLPGIFNDQIDIINVSKKHPIVSMMENQLNENRGTERSGILPAISVIPANPKNAGFTLGQGFKPEIVNDAFITLLKSLSAMTDKEIQREVLITKKQIDLILAAYKRNAAGGLRSETHEWRRKEEVNVSLWSESPDVDMLLANLLDSMFANIQVGTTGDNSKIQDFEWSTTRGLTNFNFGRVIFGTEYSLTFLNTYNNYTIFSDTVITGIDFTGTFIVSGD